LQFYVHGGALANMKGACRSADLELRTLTGRRHADHACQN
jgi:hypothetical protein